MTTALRVLFPLLALASLPTLTRAQSQSPRSAPVPRGVLWDDQDGDVRWASALRYKARLAADGVDYVPLLGTHAPSLPLRLSLAMVTAGTWRLPLKSTAPCRAGNRVEIAHGAVRELWDLRPEQAEQSFVFDAPLPAGDLRLLLRLDTELAFAGSDAAGLRFTASGADGACLGEVRYSHATVVDARGERLATPVRCDGHQLELHVPGWFLETAAWPVTIDPVVRTIAVASSTREQHNPDSTYVRLTGGNLWVVVYEERVSITDRDILARRYDDAGNFVDELAIDVGLSLTLRPSVATTGAQSRALIAFERFTVSGNRDIVAREINSSGSLGTAFTVASGTVDQALPDVGGATNTAVDSNLSLIVWESSPTANNLDVLARIYDSNARTLGPILTLANTTALEHKARVNKVRSGSDTWMVVFESDSNVQCLGVTSGGAVGTPIDFATGVVDTAPDVTGDGTTFLVIAARSVASGNRDLFARRLVRRSAGFFTGPAAFDLTTLEPGAQPGLDQLSPRIDTDGVRYSYTYIESSPATGSQVMAATFDGASGFDEGHVQVEAGGFQHTEPAITARRSGNGGAGRYLIALAEVNPASPADTDIHAVLWNGTRPGDGVTPVVTGCGGTVGGGPPALTLFEESLPPALGATLQFFLPVLGGGTPLYLVGFPPPAPIALCPGIGTCKLGVTTFLLLHSSNHLTLPIPEDPSLLGALLAVQGMEILLGARNGCGTTFSPLDFSMTNTLQIRIQ